MTDLGLSAHRTYCRRCKFWTLTILATGSGWICGLCGGESE